MISVAESKFKCKRCNDELSIDNNLSIVVEIWVNKDPQIWFECSNKHIYQAEIINKEFQPIGDFLIENEYSYI